jgi:hypothetical protein
MRRDGLVAAGAELACQGAEVLTEADGDDIIHADATIHGGHMHADAIWCRSRRAGAGTASRANIHGYTATCMLMKFGAAAALAPRYEYPRLCCHMQADEMWCRRRRAGAGAASRPLLGFERVGPRHRHRALNRQSRP